MNISSKRYVFLGLTLGCLVSATTVIAQTLSDELANGEALQLRMGVNGEVKEVLVAPGQRVKPGEVLIRLIAVRYQSRLDAAAAAVDSLGFQLQLKQAELDRQRELYEEGSLSTVELQNVEFELKQAKATLASARADYHAAKRDLAGSQIVAPIAGEIVAVPLVGQRVNIERGADVLVKLRADK